MSVLRNRRGWNLIETVVALSLLATAVVGITKYVATARRNQQSNWQWWYCQVSSDNVAARLQKIPFEKLNSDVASWPSIEKSLPDNYELAIEVREFEAAEVQGKQITVRVSDASKQMTRTSDLWRFKEEDQ
ncbi:hypothetical protein FF011L_20120 [Roseimaritima multifibrata]|uniref:Uncharacterized protein n=1 Tax=Roseimaritima multifibrata TaxID=1930274 RepID=A0A517MED1_9BACT|nr:hypothetical protein [Roseimaritima multifibrata]QDS93250.1 hypothetical protein FF011L_20120 [Roseimaritima multifibrata]